MKAIKAAVIVSSVAALNLVAIAYAAEKFDFGKREYDGNCAVCHGKDGKGLGPYAGILNTRIPDITTLSQRNKGVFPLSRVQELVDGRQSVAAHGPRDMPIWGSRYFASAQQAYFDVPYDNEAFVRTRVLALTEYVYRLQVK